jgi:endo-1,4-beta-xylanase
MAKYIPGISILLTMAFTVSDENQCSESKLHEMAPFPIGVAINTEKLKYEERYWQTALSQFNSFTPEKVLKPQYVHPKRDAYHFEEVDHLMDFCREKKIRLHGHTLVWHKALPAWMEKFKGDRTAWENLLKEHVQTVVGHCRGQVRSWDVVNEAFNEDGTLRRNVWLANIGEDYIALAFRFAREADPSSVLFYNDYSLEARGAKLAAVLGYLDELKDKGIKVDGIGLQMHVGLEYPPLENIAGAVKDIEAHGYLVHFSELDVSLVANQKLFAGGKKLRAEQKERVKAIVKCYMRLKPESRFGITLWGVSDNDSWLSEESLRARPTLYDHRYRPKPAYCGFLEGLAGK